MTPNTSTQYDGSAEVRSFRTNLPPRSSDMVGDAFAYMLLFHPSLPSSSHIEDAVSTCRRKVAVSDAAHLLNLIPSEVRGQF